MLIREAKLADIPGMQIVRHAVKENRLSDPALVPDQDVADYISRRGKGWVLEEDGQVFGFAIISVIDRNVWALFLDPSMEKSGWGRQLHHIMLDWYFRQTRETVWLSTAPATRAEQFYKRAGWKEKGLMGKEVRFEMSREDWMACR